VAIHILLRGGNLQVLRLVSGLILFAFAAMHFINHALGLIGLEVMHEMQAWRLLITRSWPGTVILGAALATHIGLALAKLMQRRTLRMPMWEALQILVALTIPFMLLPHIVDTRVGDWGFGIGVNYLYELHHLWPAKAPGSIALLLLVWIHSCIGLHYWLRLYPGYRRWAPMLAVPAAAIPVLAIAGFIVGGRRTAEILADPAALAAFKERARWPGEADRATLEFFGRALKLAFGALLGLVAVVVAVRSVWDSRRQTFPDRHAAANSVAITYVDGPTFPAVPGMTVLEASRAAGMPHASVCGGRARCATCRIRITEGREALPPPALPEAAVLAAVGATADQRLACQLRLVAPITVEVLFRPEQLSPIPIEFTEVKEVAAAHIRALIANEHVDMPATDRAQLRDWIEKQFSHGAPRLIDLSSDRFPLLGARIDYLNNRPVLAIVYRVDMQPISVFVLSASGADTLALSGLKDTCNVLGWSDPRFAYFAASEAPRAEIDRLEEEFAKLLVSSDPTSVPHTLEVVLPSSASYTFPSATGSGDRTTSPRSQRQ
jgi:adenylate cyclase